MVGKLRLAGVIYLPKTEQLSLILTLLTLSTYSLHIPLKTVLDADMAYYKESI